MGISLGLPQNNYAQRYANNHIQLIEKNVRKYGSYNFKEEEGLTDSLLMPGYYSQDTIIYTLKEQDYTAIVRDIVTFNGHTEKSWFNIPVNMMRLSTHRELELLLANTLVFEAYKPLGGSYTERKGLSTKRKTTNPQGWEIEEPSSLDEAIKHLEKALSKFQDQSNFNKYVA
jgi:hypothetical protein